MFRVAIVGRPNVGKSALFNRLVGKTVSIVHDQIGITRDRISAVARRGNRDFEFVDTGGIGLFESENTPGEIAKAVQMQVEIAIESADMILMVTDGLEGLRPLDRDIALKFHKSGKKTRLVINKLDLPAHEKRATEFHELGMTPVFCVSASHGRGMEKLWEELEHSALSTQHSALSTPEASALAPRIAIVGRPNVGKSSLTNRLAGMERVIVNETPGTTRDSIDLVLRFGNKSHVLTDTAGIRHRSRIRSSVESYSRHWTERSIKRSDLVLLLLDAKDGPTRQDCEIAGLILEHQKPCILLINKWDLNETAAREMSKGRRRAVSRSEYEKALRARMAFLDYAPVMFISALQGYHVTAIWKQIEQVLEARSEVFTTGLLNRIFSRAQQSLQPPMRQGKRLRIYYAAQKAGASTPTFLLFINQRRLWVESYERYLMNRLRKENPLTGCPIVFQLREHSRQSMPGRSGSTAK